MPILQFDQSQRWRYFLRIDDGLCPSPILQFDQSQRWRYFLRIDDGLCPSYNLIKVSAGGICLELMMGIAHPTIFNF